MHYAVPAPSVTSIPVHGQSAAFPVHRIYCVGRNYEDHAREMGATEREAPFFFLKPGDAACCAAPEQALELPYPTLTSNLHHEVELVVAIGIGGSHIAAAHAERHIFGYAVGLDLTRRDLQNDLKKQGRPWSIAKAFDHSAPLGTITPKAQAGAIGQASISLTLNGVTRQHGRVDAMIWNIAETIEQLSRAWTLQPGDLIFTGTPAGVGPIVRGDTVRGHVSGLQDLEVRFC